nr:MAG TPA: hypothetical protein [Caudoviricetes sp.]
MINIKDLKIGQILYLVRKGYESNIHKRELDKISKVEVIKVGRKYVTVSVGGYFETFDSQKDFKIYNGYERVKFGLYFSEKDYFDELKKEKLLKKIRDSFNYSNKQCEMLSLKDLETINEIIEKY